MFIQVIPNRGSPPAILLRESYREGGKVKKRTLCNLTRWPPSLLEGFKALLKGGTVISAPAAPEVFTIRRALPHGHVAAVLGSLRQIGLDRILGPDGNRCRDLVIAMVAARLTEPTSKLATAKALSPETAASSLGEIMGLGAVDEDELYSALDWLAERQAAVEAALARRHLHDGTLVLYDVSSSYVEGRRCELARLGYNRDRKRGKLQIVYGLLCAPDGCPIAVEVFAGDTADPMTLSAQIAKLKERFGLAHVVLVGDRGLITQARIDTDLAPAGLDWITALRAPAICGLVEGGHLQLSLFDERDMAAITSPDYPGERLIVCRNPDLARERARKREDLLCATQGDRLRGSGIPARALLCFMSCLATSEVGHGERSDKAAPDRTLLGPQGPAPNLEGRLSAAGDHASRALRNTGGRGGLRRSPALGCEEPGLPAPVFTVQRWPSLP
jgi:hypothetical protein